MSGWVELWAVEWSYERLVGLMIGWVDFMSGWLEL